MDRGLSGSESREIPYRVPRPPESPRHFQKRKAVSCSKQLALHAVPRDPRQQVHNADVASVSEATYGGCEAQRACS
jgi:hypothetical protein